jgi:hypothetical protein
MKSRELDYNNLGFFTDRKWCKLGRFLEKNASYLDAIWMITQNAFNRRAQFCNPVLAIVGLLPFIYA